MFFLVHYARVMWGIRRFLSRKGLLQRLEARAEASDGGLWFRSLFSVLDFDDFHTLDTPWWALASGRRVADFLEKHPGARVLEWGSGASTVWLGKRSGEVISIESDADWAAKVSRVVGPAVSILTPKIPRALRPGGIRSKRWGFRHLDFSAYVTAIDDLPGAFDLIVIDGRAREACFERALQRVSPGGVVLFDNTNRRRYRAALARYKEQIEVVSDTGLTPILLWPSRTSVIRRVDSYAAIGEAAPTEAHAQS